MIPANKATLLDHIRRLVAPPPGDALDRDLLDRFVRERDEAAFTALVRRHGPMVHGVARRMMGDDHAADDVYQAAFLVLARKAATLDRRGSLAGWLHTVTSRLALKSRRQAVRQKARERQVLPANNATDDLHWREVRGILDEELHRLPARLRLPLVLCYLQGMTRDEAAQHLEWSLATVKRRLDEGRTRLRDRLQRRGLGLSAALLTTALGEQANLAAESVAPTVRAALAFAAGEIHPPATEPAITLAQGVLRTMTLSKLKIAAALVLFLGTVAVGSGWLWQPALAETSDELPNAPAAKAQPALPVHKGLAVHEWGVWRIHRDLDMANADMRAVWEGLPKFVYGQVAGRDLPNHWNNRLSDRPVLFFHAKDPVDVTLRVDVPGGVPAVWWPSTHFPSEEVGMLGEPKPQERPFRHLEWRLRIKEARAAERVAPLPHVDDGHWVKTLRAVKADDVFSSVGERGFGLQREHFVYYDALVPSGVWPTLSFDKDDVLLANGAAFALADVTVVERGADRVRVACVPKVDARAGPSALTFRQEKLEGWPARAAETLTKQLTDAGLNADEAGSLVELSKKELFETEGTTLFYRMPRAEYDRQLPLTVTPRPEQVVRVGLAVHPHCEPDLAKTVEALVVQLDDDKFATRQQAQARLEKMGRAAYGILARVRKQGYYGPNRLPVDLALRKRVDNLLEKYDAASAVVPKAP